MNEFSVGDTVYSIYYEGMVGKVTAIEGDYVRIEWRGLPEYPILVNPNNLVKRP